MGLSISFSCFLSYKFLPFGLKKITVFCFGLIKEFRIFIWTVRLVLHFFQCKFWREEHVKIKDKEIKSEAPPLQYGRPRPPTWLSTQKSGPPAYKTHNGKIPPGGVAGSKTSVSKMCALNTMYKNYKIFQDKLWNMINNEKSETPNLYNIKIRQTRHFKYFYRVTTSTN